MLAYPDQGVQVGRVPTPRPGRLLQQLLVRVLPGVQEVAARVSLQLAHAHLKVGVELVQGSGRVLLTMRGWGGLLVVGPVDGNDDLAHLLAYVAPVNRTGLRQFHLFN